MTLRTKTILKAKAQATALVTPLEQQLVKAIFISDSNFNNYYYPRNRQMSLAYTANESLEDPIDIEFADIKVESEVTVKFSIN